MARQTEVFARVKVDEEKVDALTAAISKARQGIEFTEKALLDVKKALSDMQDAFIVSYDPKEK